MGILNILMNTEIKEAIQHINSVLWYLERDHRIHLLPLVTFAEDWNWKEGALSTVLAEQILHEARKLKEGYELVEETETTTRKVLRAKV